MCEIKNRICGSDLTLSSVNAVVASPPWIIWPGRFLFASSGPGYHELSFLGRLL